ncbi:MAG TPA: cation:proton antiporter [Rubrobacteraceae bacterium]|nr:cation:proton antiporter [Rubrobacteraceae bacterium]
MSELNIVLLTIGAVVLVIGLFSAPIKRSFLSVPLVALLAGVLLSPAVFGVLDPAAWGGQTLILEQAARLTVAISLMEIALRLPKGYPFSRWRSLLVMLGPVMVLMFVASGLLAYAILGVSFWVAMLIGAIVTPTDPVVASSIVQGEVAENNLPARIRYLLSGESGANDGLAYPFVFLAILMIQEPPGEAILHWITRVILWEVLGAVIIGALIGYVAGKALDWARRHGEIRNPSFLAYSIALALTALGSTRLVGTDGILAVFAAGVAFNMAISADTEEQEERIDESVNRFFVLPIFVLLGLSLPWGEWVGLGWKGPVLAGLILLLRRPPWVLALAGLVPRMQGTQDGLFTGWFGPIGVAALYYATLAEHTVGLEEVWVVGSLVISVSVLVHGVSAAPLTRFYGRKAGNGS